MTLNLDADVRNSDWPKAHSWDLPVHNARDLADFLLNHGIPWVAFVKLPVYRFNSIALPWINDAEELMKP